MADSIRITQSGGPNTTGIILTVTCGCGALAECAATFWVSRYVDQERFDFRDHVHALEIPTGWCVQGAIRCPACYRAYWAELDAECADRKAKEQAAVDEHAERVVSGGEAALAEELLALAEIERKGGRPGAALRALAKRLREQPTAA